MKDTVAMARCDVGANTIISLLISLTAKVRQQKDDRIDLYQKKINSGRILNDSFIIHIRVTQDTFDVLIKN